MKGSKLKPDAPAFVPTCSKPHSVVHQSTAITKAEARDAAKAQKRFEQEEQKALGTPKKTGKRAAKRSDGLGKWNSSARQQFADFADTSASATDEGLSSGVPNDATEGNASGADKPNPKRPRFANRRHIAKSEPATRWNESIDGTQDSDGTPFSSGEGQALLQVVMAVRPPNPPPPITSTNALPATSSRLRPK